MSNSYGKGSKWRKTNFQRFWGNFDKIVFSPLKPNKEKRKNVKNGKKSKTS